MLIVSFATMSASYNWGGPLQSRFLQTFQMKKKKKEKKIWILILVMEIALDTQYTVYAQHSKHSICYKKLTY